MKDVIKLLCLSRKYFASKNQIIQLKKENDDIYFKLLP